MAMAMRAMQEKGGFSGRCDAFINENGNDQIEFERPNEYGESGERYRFEFVMKCTSLFRLFLNCSNVGKFG